MAKMDNLETGQIFQSEDGLLWKLERFAPVTLEIPHVVLVDPKDRTVNKLIARSVLLDRRRFSSKEDSRAL